MLKKIVLFMFCFGLSVNCSASSSDAWKEFGAEVKSACEKAAPGLLKLNDYHITTDPFGSESYGIAVITGKTSERAEDSVCYICVYDKKSKKAEIGSEMRESDMLKNKSSESSSRPKADAASGLKGPKLNETGGLNGINASTPFPIKNHEKYLPGYTASLKQGSREGEPYDYMAFYKDGKLVAEITGENGKVSSILIKNYVVIPMVEGRIGDRFETFIWAGDEKTYKACCVPGAEEWSGKIICNTRDGSREDTKHIRHIFSGDYSGPDGDLPPLDAAKAFTIEATIWEK